VEQSIHIFQTIVFCIVIYYLCNCISLLLTGGYWWLLECDKLKLNLYESFIIGVVVICGFMFEPNI